MILICGIERDDTPVNLFVRYKPSFIGKWHIGKESEIINSLMFEYENWRDWLINKRDTDMAELIYSEVQLIRPKYNEQ